MDGQETGTEDELAKLRIELEAAGRDYKAEGKCRCEGGCSKDGGR